MCSRPLVCYTTVLNDELGLRKKYKTVKWIHSFYTKMRNYFYFQYTACHRCAVRELHSGEIVVKITQITIEPIDFHSNFR